MEKNNEKGKNIIIGVLLAVIVCLSIALVFVCYNKYNLKENNNDISKSEQNTNETNIVLDEEDVKNWLESNSGIIESYFVNKQNDFDYSVATEKDYSEFLFWRILGDSKAIEIKDIHESSNYSSQYTYKLDYIRTILNSYFGVGIDKINIDIMNSYSKDYANFSIDGEKFIVKFNSFDGGPDICQKLNKIYVKDNQIVVNYDIIKRISYDECGEKRDYGRELLLKKTNDGYNLLKSYKVD